jgi:hypothetical protein
MKLLTKKIKDKLRKAGLYGNENSVYESEVIVKLFNPSGTGTWYIIGGEELDNGEWLLFGYCHILMWELGSVSLKELEKFKGPFGLGIERDKFFEPCTLQDLIDGGYINESLF